MQKQKEMARSGRKSTEEEAWKESTDPKDIPETIFTGYETLEGEAKVLAIYKDGEPVSTAEEGDKVKVYVDKTPFYAESGGQVSDNGFMSTKLFNCKVLSVEKRNGIFAHTVIVDKGELTKGMSPSKLIAARDEFGFRPLCYGQKDDGTYIVASETCALDSVGASYIRDIEPGEIVIFDSEGIRTIEDHCNKKPHKICIFEYLYFARPDSIIEGKGVHNARLRAGACLAMEHPVQADVVIGVPDSGLDAAIGYSRQSGIPYGIGFIKNKYIGRTFIAPGQKDREDKVRIKLNVLSDTVKDKRVVLVDDSIVRGTTCARIVKLLRDAGAKEVHMRSSAPAFTNPCFYGTDIDSKENLIACQHPLEEIAGVIGADSMGYLDINHLNMLIGSQPGVGYCDSCFSGTYPTETPTEGEKNRFEKKISEK